MSRSLTPRHVSTGHVSRSWRRGAPSRLRVRVATVKAELIALPAWALYPLPEEVSFEDGAAFPLVFETAYRMLVTKANLQPGETVFVWGVGGGVATAALQIAKALGARVVVTSSSDEKLA